MADLRRYRERRDSLRTPEPFGGEGLAEAAPGGARRFCVQQHGARRMHWDLRLEVDGALASWAVPRGPSLDPGERRLAVRTEDHPLEYADFEGVIPAGSYGAGAMILWDRGSYRTVDGRSPERGVADGKLDLVLAGHKLSGRFALVRTRSENEWLLLRKGRAPEDGGELVERQPESVLSGLTVQELARGRRHDDEALALARAAGAPEASLDVAALRPMLAARADEPFSRPGWLFELKVDGVRVLCEARGGRGRIFARAGGERTALYPEIARALAHLPVSSAVLDGEIVVLDERGRSSFERLQRRFTQTDPRAVARAATEDPVVFVAFDCLEIAGHDLRRLPLSKRKEALALCATRRGFVRFADHVEGDGLALFEAVREHGLEGVVAKRADSVYESGRRSRSWLKIKAPRQATLAIVGFLAGRGSRARLGSLMVAFADPGGEGLVYAGNVGSGLDDATIEALLPRLEASRAVEAPCRGLPDPLPRGAALVEPELACRVRFTELTSAGSLRQPVFEALLDGSGPAQIDRAPASREDPGPAPPEPPEPELEPTRLDKVFWPVEGYTKGDLLAYYEAVWPWLEPYLRDRPVVLTRYPDGIEGKHFYQKNAPEFTPPWARRERIDDTDYFVCNDLRTLLYVVNSGAIPLHVWSARIGSLDRPDWLVLDLDPKQAPFADVVRVARHLHALLRALGAPHFAKTSGQDGLHVLLPLGGRLEHAEARGLGEVLARVVQAELPGIATVARPLAARGERVYLDFLQNGRGKLIAAPLSVRPRAGAPVSMPLTWRQVGARLDPARFDIRSAPRILARRGDPLIGVLEGEPADVEGLLEALAQRLERAID